MFNALLALPHWLYLIFAFVALVLVIGWILLPFIMMNTNAYLRRVLRQQERINELLEAMRPPRATDASVPSMRVDPRDTFIRSCDPLRVLP